MEQEIVNFMEHMWMMVENDVVTVGLNEEAFESFDDIQKSNLPEEGSLISPHEVCGELETDQGPLNLYSPVEGKIIEINEAVLQNPQLIIEDHQGDGWLFRVEAEKPEQIDEFFPGTYSDEELEIEE